MGSSHTGAQVMHLTAKKKRAGKGQPPVLQVQSGVGRAGVDRPDYINPQDPKNNPCLGNREMPQEK